MQEVKETHKIVLEIIKANPGISKPRICELSGKTKNVVQNSVIKLEAQKLVHLERLGANSVAWYAAGQVTIIRRVENAIIEADKAVTGMEIAAMCNIESQKVYQPINRLTDMGVIYRGPDVGQKGKAVMTYLHPINNKASTVMQVGANSLNMPVEKYEELLDKELGPAIHDSEMRAFLNSYYPGSNAKRLFVGGV